MDMKTTIVSNAKGFAFIGFMFAGKVGYQEIKCTLYAVAFSWLQICI